MIDINTYETFISIEGIEATLDKLVDDLENITKDRSTEVKNNQLVHTNTNIQGWQRRCRNLLKDFVPAYKYGGIRYEEVMPMLSGKVQYSHPYFYDGLQNMMFLTKIKYQDFYDELEPFQHYRVTMCFILHFIAEKCNMVFSYNAQGCIPNYPKLNREGLDYIADNVALADTTAIRSIRLFNKQEKEIRINRKNPDLSKEEFEKYICKAVHCENLNHASLLQQRPTIIEVTNAYNEDAHIGEDEMLHHRISYDECKFYIKKYNLIRYVKHTARNKMKS